MQMVHRENVLGAGLGAVTFFAYLTTLCRSVGYTDSGELASVICSLGIAHPTGYPLFTVLGKCWLMLPLPWEEIIRLNILSAVLVSVAIGLFFKTTLALRRALRTFMPGNGGLEEWKEIRFILASSVASLTLGFSITIWSQSVSLEVYSLQLVLVLLTALTFINGLEGQLQQPLVTSRYLICFAFVLGLNFCNHMTTVLLAPAFLWLYFRALGFRRESFARILTLLPFFLSGLSLYLYLPIRSAARPLLNWGNPDTLERFLWHVSGKQYRIWMFSGWDVAGKQLKYYVGNFPAEFNFLAIACAAVGLVALWRQSRRVMVFLLLIFCTTILYAVNYDIFDIDSYFMVSYLAAGWIVAYGIDAIFGFAEVKPRSKAIVAAILLAVPALQLVSHWKSVNEMESTLPQQFVEKAFSDLEPNAVVLSTQWDYFISPSLYYRFVQKKRNDLTIIDKSLLQDRSWYFDELRRQAPWLMERVDGRAHAFLTELRKFEHNEAFDFRTIQACWLGLLADIVAKSMPDHAVYIDARIDREFPSGYRRIPTGFFLRLGTVDSISAYQGASFSLSGSTRKNPVVQDFEQYYVLVLLYDAQWLIQHKDYPKAKESIEKALRLSPGNKAAMWMASQLPK